MSVLERGKTVDSRSPELRITNALAPGRHRFALEVIGADGRRSARDVVTVTIVARPREVRDPAPST